MDEKIQQFERRKFYTADDSGRVFLILILSELIMSFVLAMGVNAISTGLEIKSSQIYNSVWYTVVYSFLLLAIYILIYLIYNNTYKIHRNAIKLNSNLKTGTIFVIIALAIISLFGLNYIVSAFDDLLGLFGYPVKTDGNINATDWGSYLLSVVCVCLIPAFGEELIFRGMILNGLRYRFSDKISVVLSALLFMLMHQNLQQLIYPFVVGLLMGYLVIKTNSLWSSIILHFCNNFMVQTLQFIQNTTGFSVALPKTWWGYVLSAVIALVAVLIVFLVHKFYFSKHDNTVLPEEKQSGVSKHNYLFLAFCVGGIMFVLSAILTIVS